MGGSLSVKSEMGSGSTFTVCVPIKAKNSPSTESKRSAIVVDKSATALLTVLLVDDNKVICKLIGNVPEY
jgi:D-arabinose 5-phosphate isomerase GutQ